MEEKNYVGGCNNEKVSDFKLLLEAFEEQLFAMEDNSNIIFDKINKIKKEPDTDEKKEHSIKEPVPTYSGILADIWNYISKFRYLNERLNYIKNELSQLVG